MTPPSQRELIVKILSNDFCPSCGAAEGQVLTSNTPEHARYVNCLECHFHHAVTYYNQHYTWTLGKRLR